MYATQLEECRLPYARARLFLLVATGLILSAAGAAFAGSATWSSSPANGNWNSAINWSPMTVPDGPADTATFGSSSVTNISLSADTEVNGIVFNPGAGAFTITARPQNADVSETLTIGGAGVINNSGVIQNFVVDAVSNPNNPPFGFGLIEFTGSASAGNMTVFTNKYDSVATIFRDNSNAGAATINCNAAFSEGIGGLTRFVDNSSAGNATINAFGPAENQAGGIVSFEDSSNAGNAIITAYGSTASFIFQESLIFFSDKASAGNATLIAYGGSNGGPGGAIEFLDNSSGGTARIELFGNGVLGIDGSKTIGSLEGTGNVTVSVSNFNFKANLTVGSNNLSTIFSGEIVDSSQFGVPPGSLTKIGTGTLVLSGASTYTGGTTINAGVLQVDNTRGSGTGTGSVTVNSGGKLSGTGTIAGNVLNHGIVSPGDSPGTLHVGGSYSQSTGGTLDIEIASLVSFDQLVIAGTARLGGVLDVTLDGYIAHEGDVFTILTSSGLTGNFARFELPTLDDGLFFKESRTSNNVLLTVTGSTSVPDWGSTLLLLAGALVALLGLQRIILSYTKPIYLS